MGTYINTVILAEFYNRPDDFLCCLMNLCKAIYVHGGEEQSTSCTPSKNFENWIIKMQ
jgi:hypothetical protein